MGIINLLDIQVANLIAAGEVVDRPASVVKELAENGIDAHATRLDIEIKRGGASFIRVTDNGVGMVRDDVPLSLRRHATSKIKEAADLDGIITLGFRGEALAAISSVSKMRIMTRHKSEKTGTLLESESGTVYSVSDFNGSVGTSVIVEELFANVPARRKFLKADKSEGIAVAAIVEKIALSRPDVAIKFISDGEIKFQTIGDGKLINVVYAVLGRDIANRTLRVNAMTEGVEITGFIGAPDVVHGNRNFQNFFINGRYIRSKTAIAALEQAFKSYCEVDKFPVCVLNIVLHPAFVDVNVHPTKLEVKFSNEKTVFDAVYCAVRNTLNESIPRPKLNVADVTPRMVETHHVTPEQRAIYNSFLPVYDRIAEPKLPERQQKISDSPSAPISREKLSFDEQYVSEPGEVLPNIPNEPTVTSPIMTPLTATSPVTPPSAYTPIPPRTPVAETAARPIMDTPYRYIGLVFNTYIIVEAQGKIMMVDKHAAHERIIFEEMRRVMKSGEAASQILITPIEITLSQDDRRALNDFGGEIMAVGFGFSERENLLSVNEIPSGINSSQARDMLLEILFRLSSGTGGAALTREQVYESALYQASCKAAVKAGTNDDPAHLRYICDKLFEPDGTIAYCPHGRPVAFEMTKNSIENSFRRG